MNTEIPQGTLFLGYEPLNMLVDSGEWFDLVRQDSCFTASQVLF